MNEQAHDHTNASTTDAPGSYRGSAWAALDDTFFRMTAEVFSHAFCAGATALLADNDEGPDSPSARRAAMRRHPSSRGRA
jgi:hypothetical protein